MGAQPFYLLCGGQSPCPLGSSVKLPIKAVGNFATGMTRLVVFVVIVLVILFFSF